MWEKRGEIVWPAHLRVFSLVDWAVEITETQLGYTFLLTQIGVQVPDRFGFQHQIF